MFGTLRPHLCRLGADDRQAWRRLYCGTCRALGTRHGHLCRAALSHDVVLIAAVAAGLAPDEAPAAVGRCPLPPWRRREVLPAQALPVRVAAALQVALTDQALADHVSDGRLSARLARRLLGRRGRAAFTELRELGFVGEPLTDVAARQQEAQRAPEVDAATVAAPTASALDEVFGQLPSIVGATAGLADRLGRLGRQVGSVVYLVDALEDLGPDARRGDFNPLLEPAGKRAARVSSERLEAAVAMLEEALEEIRALVAAIPWTRHRELITHVLCEQLPNRVEAAVEQARQLCGRLIRRRSSPVRMALAFVMLWVGLARGLSRPVRRFLRRRRHRREVAEAACALELAPPALAAAGAAHINTFSAVAPKRPKQGERPPDPPEPPRRRGGGGGGCCCSNCCENCCCACSVENCCRCAAIECCCGCCDS